VADHGEQSSRTAGDGRQQQEAGDSSRSRRRATAAGGGVVDSSVTLVGWLGAWAFFNKLQKPTTSGYSGRPHH
jgi:hypothetical protein